ncbi:uncharacterized protein BX664DRAFT_334016 [Halteromyces radiatus]|uniref:uncharacterized protein n=1 Tax=Halteromyces radiatus TaxID=101107 RepID=UPI0022210FE3|nr:uncharacterized protein BX664DRAFT_334016 [Halteromyces radiatus]KAI8089832.1 hypothetical protein BX664DRAFT_334016 [Halteromyces radiatus]
MTKRPSEEDDFFISDHGLNTESELDILRSKLSRLEEEKIALKHKLAEEKLAYLISTSFADIIQDPRRQKAIDMKEVHKKIIQQTVAATQARRVQEVMSSYRLAGYTTFTFQNKYMGVRLDTFYNRHYYEPYYIFLPKDKPDIIERHTVPFFIPIKLLAKRLLPDNLDSLLRILHDLLLAYVAKREQVKALKCHVDTSIIKVNVDDASFSAVEIIVPDEDPR